MNAPAQFQRILRRSGTMVKLRMDQFLQFWVEAACDNLQCLGGNLTKHQLLTQILQQYERRGDAMRYLDEQGKIAWKASPHSAQRSTRLRSTARSIESSHTCITMRSNCRTDRPSFSHSCVKARKRQSCNCLPSRPTNPKYAHKNGRFSPAERNSVDT